MGFMNILVTVLSKIGHSHDRHHLFDSVSGYLMIGFRVIIFIVFLGGIFVTFREVRHNLKMFLLKFALLSGLYLASMPLIVLIGNLWVDPAGRN